MKTSKAEAEKIVEELLVQIRQKASGGDCIFRGESKGHSKVTSTLYRDYQKEIDARDFDIKVVETAIVEEVREITHEKDDNVILEQLQHYGGKTNQIDFSTDYFVALFFACYGKYEDDGRVILLNEKKIKTHKPTTPQNRVIAQKSIFVRSSTGFIEPNDDEVVSVPSELKKDVLEYLNKYHNINTATIYNDIHGYISQTKIHESAYTYFYRGLTHQDKGDIDKAISAYKDAIELNPNFEAAYNNRGGAYAKKGDNDLAIADYNKAIGLNPNYAPAYNNRGNAYDSKGEHDIAIADFNKAIEINPNYADAYYNRGSSYSDKDEHDNAISDYNKAIEINPNHVEAYNNRGVVYNNKGEYDLAIADHNKDIEINPNHVEAYINRGIAYNRKGDFDLTIADCNKAIELNPNCVEAYSNRGHAYNGKGENDLAIADYNKVIEINPNDAAAYNNRGIIYGENDNYEFALADFNKAISLNPNHAKAYFNLGITKKALKDIKGAREALETALKLAEQQRDKALAAEIQKEINNLAEPK